MAIGHKRHDTRRWHTQGMLKRRHGISGFERVVLSWSFFFMSFSSSSNSEGKFSHFCGSYHTVVNVHIPIS